MKTQPKRTRSKSASGDPDPGEAVAIWPSDFRSPSGPGQTGWHPWTASWQLPPTTWSVLPRHELPLLLNFWCCEFCSFQPGGGRGGGNPVRLAAKGKQAVSTCWHKVSNTSGISRRQTVCDGQATGLFRPHVRFPSHRWGCPLRGLQSTPSPAQRVPGPPSSLFTPAPMPDSPNSKHTHLPSLFSSFKNRRVLLKVKACTHVRACECMHTHMHTYPDAPCWAGGEGTKEGRQRGSLHWMGRQRNAVSCKRQEANY